LKSHTIKAQNGHIVLAVLNGVLTVRFLQKNDHFCRLIPANKKCPEITVTLEMNMPMWGVVTRIMIDPKEIPSYTRW
jgi:SOS-response transcriptional repressor LexA